VLVLDYGKRIAEGVPAEVAARSEGDRGLSRRRDGAACMKLLEIRRLEVRYGGIAR